MTRTRTVTLFVLLSVLAPGCVGTWQEPPVTAGADARAVALALGDPPPRAVEWVSDVPTLDPPHHARPCCAFGMDLHVDFAGLQVPFFEVGNVIDPTEITTHVYAIPDVMPEPETNGLVYTCRGGWVDTAHVHENVDDTVYFAMSIAPHLLEGTTVELPGLGGTTTVVVDPVPAELVEREGAITLAGEIAAWITWRISIWHEVATWFGYQSVPGFSEQPSAFSIEDLYSNALGIHLGLALLDVHGYQSRESYERLEVAYVRAALDRLEVQPREVSRAVMGLLDGSWWDSTRRLPDNHLVMRRHFPDGEEWIRPWRAEDALAAGDTSSLIAGACRGASARPLSLVTRIGHQAPRDLVHVSWAPESWAEGRFPFEGETRVVTESQLDDLVERTRALLEQDLGAGFDQPGPRPAP